MYRRALLTTTAIATASIAGCVDGGSGDADSEEGDPVADSEDDESPVDADDSDGDDDASESAGADVEVATDPDARSVDVSEIDPAEAGAAGQASIEFATAAVHVAGTVVGETGCHGVELASTTTIDEGAFRIVVAAVDDADPDELCTQAMTDIGYEVDASFADGLPESVAVVHDDADGREVVATESPDTDE